MGSTVTSTATVLFQSDQNNKGQIADGPPFKAVNFDVASNSAVALLVNIPPLHGAAYYPIAVGTSKEFIVVGINGGANGHLINVRGSSGTATYSGGITG